MATKRMVLPWGEWLPDRKRFGNQGGLLTADQLVPVYGSYAVFPGILATHSVSLTATYGHHCDLAGNRRFARTAANIYELDGVHTSRRAALATPDLVSGSQWTNYGASVIETSYVSPAQVLLPGAAAFVNLITSTFAPAAKFAFPVRNNLFLANCSLAAPYDTLAAGANPTLVAWSRNDDARLFGSANVDPQYIGADYQPCNYDLGDITGGLGGLDYGLIALQRGVVRVDGPPYTFRPIIAGTAFLYPNSWVRAAGDVYVWCESGPAVLRGGEGPLVHLGNSKVTRTLLDNGTDFSQLALSSALNPIYLSGAADESAGLIFWAYTSNLADSDQQGDRIVVYNYREDRFTIGRVSAGEGALFLRQVRSSTPLWSPGKNIGFMYRIPNGGTPQDYPYTFDYVTAFALPSTLADGFTQYEPDVTTRVLRVRPILTKGAASALPAIGVTVTDTNYAGDDVSAGPYTTVNAAGWIETPGTVFRDFHNVKWDFGVQDLGAGLRSIHEFEAYEIEYALGGEWGA